VREIKEKWDENSDMAIIRRSKTDRVSPKVPEMRRCVGNCGGAAFDIW
jgi:hypothetical protein